MKTIRIVIVAVLMAASAWALQVLWAEQANKPANEKSRGAVQYDERKSDHAD
jgi:hypothetical protein